MTIAVDFDGTIVDHKYPAVGKEIPFAITTLKRLQKDGHQIILWTAREGQLLVDAVDFCAKNGLLFFAINSDVPNDKWRETRPARKLRADVFIDDRNLGGLPDWSLIYEMVSKNLSFGDIISRSIREQLEFSMAEEKEGFLSRIMNRCRSARRKFDRSSSGYHSHNHHW